MNFSQFYTSMDHFTIIPALMLCLFGCAILLFDFMIFPDPRQRKWLLIFVVAAEAFTGWGLFRQQTWLSSSGVSSITGFSGSVTVDGFGIFFNWIFLVAALLVALVSYKYLENAGEHHGEYYGLILFAQSGMYFLATGTDLVLVIEVQGARQVRRHTRSSVLVFLLPPSAETLEQRLRSRGEDTEAQIRRRLAVAREEVRAVSEYDYVVVNDEVEDCVGRLRAVIVAERAKPDVMSGAVASILASFGVAAGSR